MKVKFKLYASLKNNVLKHETSMIADNHQSRKNRSCEFHATIKKQLFTHENPTSSINNSSDGSIFCL